MKNKRISSSIIFLSGLIGIAAVAGIISHQSTPSKPPILPPPLPIIVENGEPSLLDVIQGKRWLVVFQNPYELRPTGGFWGTIGDLLITPEGTVSLSVRNVYEIDGPSEQFASRLPLPPEPLEQYMNMKRWFLRDANWYPDFTDSSKKALELYEKETGKPVPFDGVIALTPAILTDILHSTGPVVIDGVQFDAQDALDTIIESVELKYEERNTPFFRRKEILEKLSRHLIDQIKHFSSEQLISLIRRLPSYRRQRVVQLYASDPATQETIRHLGWSGELSVTEGDYLFVVDSNLAAFKSDAVVVRSTEYQVQSRQGNMDIELHLHYHHTKKVFDYRTTRYRSYTRILVPLGTRVLSSEGTLLDDRLRNPSGKEHPLDITTYQGKTQIGFFVAVEPGDRREVILRYRLPQSVVQKLLGRKMYSLLVQHQAGVPERPLTLRVQSDTTLVPPVTVKREGKEDELIEIPLH